MLEKTVEELLETSNRILLELKDLKNIRSNNIELIIVTNIS